jgi:hypothetical protein
MRKIIEAEDILGGARNCVECISLAATDLGPIQAVADIASRKIDEAIDLLREYRESGDAPVPAPADAKPVSPVAPTNRRSK